MPKELTLEEMEQISEQANQFAKLRALAQALSEAFSLKVTAKHRAVGQRSRSKLDRASYFAGYAGNKFSCSVVLPLSLKMGYLVLDPSTDGKPWETKPIHGCNKGKKLTGYYIGYDALIKTPLVVRMNQFFKDYKAGKMPQETLDALDLIKTKQV